MTRPAAGPPGPHRSPAEAVTDAVAQLRRAVAIRATYSPDAGTATAWWPADTARHRYTAEVERAALGWRWRLKTPTAHVAGRARNPRRAGLDAAAAIDRTYPPGEPVPPHPHTGSDRPEPTPPPPADSPPRPDPGPDRFTDRYARLDQAHGPYRVGRKCPWNVYQQLGDEPDDTDVALFDAGSARQGRRVVEALNLRRNVLHTLADSADGTATARFTIDHDSTTIETKLSTGDALRDAVYAVATAGVEATAQALGEADRLSAALRICEAALTATAIVGQTPSQGPAADLLHAAQQAAAAHRDPDWRPEQQVLDDAGLLNLPTDDDPTGPDDQEK